MEKIDDNKMEMVAGGAPIFYPNDYRSSPSGFNKCKDCDYAWSTKSPDHVCPNCNGNNIEYYSFYES